ncbi:hypothetical protein PR048_026426 [Dryococelus australis]|uniref:CDK-activating kinase assembly factor MAT1 n=1 Tax=Dryococelus australis TaxID=614101 RepID=A0ABQ9GLC3_9NEOP|nr:hypothetical protein PR048_026426 [Dryococelus australis]
MDDQVCPRCKTTKYRNPALKLMVNVCGHALCDSCVDLLFLKGEEYFFEVLCKLFPMPRTCSGIERLADWPAGSRHMTHCAGRCTSSMGALIKGIWDVATTCYREVKGVTGVKGYRKWTLWFTSYKLCCTFGLLVREWTNLHKLHAGEVEVLVRPGRELADLCGLRARADEGEVRCVWSSTIMKREIPEKTHQPAVPSGTISLCKNRGLIYLECYLKFILFPGSGACPECRIPLRRNNFRVQLFEDSMVEKEVDIRKRVLRDFNKKEDDFRTLREFNDYLEEVETIIFNLVHSIDVVATNKKIEQYKKDNREIILKNKTKLGREEMELDDLLEEEKFQEKKRKQENINEELEVKKIKMRKKEELIDELMFSNADAKNILENFVQQVEAVKEEKKPVVKVSQFSSGIKFNSQSQNFMPVAKVEEGEPFVYEETELEVDGPLPPSLDAVESRGFTGNIRAESEQERAGGFRSNIACLRVLQEALMGLYHVSHRTELPAS